MTGTKTKTKPTKKGTGSPSKRRSPSSKTPTSSSRKTGTKAKSPAKSQSAGRATKGGSSSSSTNTTKTKESGSSRPGNLPNRKSDPWKDYDFDNMPELTDEQLRSFEKVSMEKYRLLASSKKRGRPPKAPDLKEKPVSIRFPLLLLQSIKEAAEREGIPWQTFIKKTLEKEVASGPYDA